VAACRSTVQKGTGAKKTRVHENASPILNQATPILHLQRISKRSASGQFIQELHFKTFSTEPQQRLAVGLGRRGSLTLPSLSFRQVLKGICKVCKEKLLNSANQSNHRRFKVGWTIADS